MGEVKINLDFEDAKPEVFVFQLPEHYAGKKVYGNVTADANARYTFTGTREEVGPVGRILTRFYSAVVIQAGSQKVEPVIVETVGEGVGGALANGVTEPEVDS